MLLTGEEGYLFSGQTIFQALASSEGSAIGSLAKDHPAQNVLRACSCLFLTCSALFGPLNSWG